LDRYITIELFGQIYRFKADAETDEAQEAANYLTEEIAKVQGQFGETVSRNDRMTVLLSVALNIAHDNLKLSRCQNEFHQQLSDHSTKILELLDTLS